MEIIITCMLVALVMSSICSVCEASLSSTPISYISMLEGKKEVETLRSFKENMHKPLSAILIVNTVANTVGASLVGSAAASYAMEQGYSESTVIGIVSAVFTLLVLMFAEILPKTIGANYWKSLIIPVVKVIQAMIFITYPMVYILGFITRFFSNESANAVSRDEISAISTEGLKEGVIDSQEHQIIKRVLSLKKHKVIEIMVPAEDVETVSESEEISMLMFGHTRVPVIDDKGFCIGFLLKYDITEGEAVKDCIRPIPSYTGDVTIREVFSLMVQKQEQIAAIVNEDGTFQGIVSFENILESILGIDIVDENDIEYDEEEDYQLFEKSLNEQSVKA